MEKRERGKYKNEWMRQEGKRIGLDCGSMSCVLEWMCK